MLAKKHELLMLPFIKPAIASASAAAAAACSEVCGLTGFGVFNREALAVSGAWNRWGSVGVFGTRVEAKQSKDEYALTWLLLYNKTTTIVNESQAAFSFSI